MRLSWAAMATKTVVEFYDDLTGAVVDIDDLHTFEWSWLGVDYLIDVSSTSVENIDAGNISVAALLKAPTRVGGRRRSTAPKHTNSTLTATGTPAPADTADIRRWARQHGYDLGQRGRIPHDIIDAYHASTR